MSLDSLSYVSQRHLCGNQQSKIIVLIRLQCACQIAGKYCTASLSCYTFFVNKIIDLHIDKLP